MLVKNQHFRTVWMQGASVFMIEQNLLPFEFKVFESKNYLETCEAITEMLVRGAGAIGATAGFALAQAVIESPEKKYLDYIIQAKSVIEATRPTAQNLFYATNRVYQAAIISKEAALFEAQKIADEDAEACRKIGEFGNTLLSDNCNIETHCNAGWLAFVDYGSALSPIYEAHLKGKNVFVYVDETRPRGQGARLTAWELKNENVPHTIIADNAGAYLMSKGKIDIIITGADRIACNGDTANKIGTLEKAICAKEYGIPFYIAAPSSTFDLNCLSGEHIPIEERIENEILYQTGIDMDGKIRKILVSSPGSNAKNPAFDITPARLITGIITEKGIIKANEEAIKKIFL